MRLGLDLDGVCYQWDKTARYMLRTMRGYAKEGPLGKQSKSWDYIKQNVDWRDWRWLWDEGVTLGLFRYGHLFPGTIEGVQALSKLADIVIITSRPKHAVQDTMDFLSYMKFPASEVHILTSGEPKSQVFPQCDVYVDDSVGNYKDLVANTNSKVLLWQRPWNENYVTHGIVHSWDEVIKEVESA